MTISALRPPALDPSSLQRHHSFGFWAAAAALLVNMGFSAVPTPLYVLYQRRDHFSTITVTLVYSVYAVGVIGSLFLGGHVSDWLGRKRVFVPALLANVVAAAIFLIAPSLPGLLVARVVSGVSVGLTTATATAYLAELHWRTPAGVRGAHRGQVVATAANLGGIGVGPLVAGLLAQYAPQPLRLPYYVFGVALLVPRGADRDLTGDRDAARASCGVAAAAGRRSARGPGHIPGRHGGGRGRLRRVRGVQLPGPDLPRRNTARDISRDRRRGLVRRVRLRRPRSDRGQPSLRARPIGAGRRPRCRHP